MNILGKKKIVLLGMMAKYPVPGVVWQTVHYLVGFERLGFEVYYVEAHSSRLPQFMEGADDGSAKAAAFIAGVLHRFDLGDRWALHALHSDGQCYGLSLTAVEGLYRSAALLINLHGGTFPRPEHTATGRLVYLETDPVAPQVQVHDNDQERVEVLAAHCAWFTFGENYGRADCKVPTSERFKFVPTRQPVVLDFWEPCPPSPASVFTTVGNWRQFGRELRYRDDVYHWSKHHEFLKFLDLPRRTSQKFELALASYEDSDRQLLEENGWRVRPAATVAHDADSYRRYLAESRGEFTVAKDQNVRLRSGWFSDRSATYLAAGRPVITQETGFSNLLPTGRGLFAFATLEDILGAVDRINSAYEQHCHAALAIAQEYFRHDVVLKPLLAEVGL